MELTEKVFTQEALKLMDAPPLETEAESEDEVAEDTPPATEPRTRGTLILDATCFPQNIKYPTDIGLLNHARELCERIIDELFLQVVDKYERKPRTYREVARKDFLAYAKTRKHTAKSIRKNIRKQLNYVARDLRHIDDLIAKGAAVDKMKNDLQKKLEVIRELYRQQKEMYDNNVKRCDNRIVSISQPHVRPIVRGKEHTPTEFGAKVSIGLVGGYAFITDMSWENVPEAKLMEQAAESYKRQFGFYPANIIGDGVYPNRDNRKWCKNRSIRISGPALGRKSEEIKKDEKQQQYKDACERNAVEGSFGTTKCKFGLRCVMAKLPDTSQTSVSMGFFVANMERKLRLLAKEQAKAKDYVFILYDFTLLNLVILECTVSEC